MPIPPPSERPDLYDYFDYPERPKGWKNPIKVPEHIQQMIDDQKRDQTVRADNAREENAGDN